RRRDLRAPSASPPASASARPSSSRPRKSGACSLASASPVPMASRCVAGSPSTSRCRRGRSSRWPLPRSQPTVAKSPSPARPLPGARLQALIPARSKVSVAVGPTAGFDVPGLLASLDRYPYGCAEQTTSRALPLIYVNEVSKRIGLASDSQIRERVEAAIARVFELQDSTGAFGIWGPLDGDIWLSSYVTDFLTRAKEAGYTLPQQPFSRALDRLQNFIGYAQDFEKGGEGRAYALYVLARNGRAPIGELRYYVDTKLEAFATPLAQAQLGAALAMLGDKARAERALEAALK